MHSATRLATATAAIVLLALAFVVGGLGIGFASLPAASHGGSAAAAPSAPLAPFAPVRAPAAPSSAHAVAHPATPVPLAGATNVTVAWKSTFAANTSIPTGTVQFAVNATTGTITNLTTKIWVQVLDTTKGRLVTNFSLNNTVNATGPNGTGLKVKSGTVAGVTYNAATWNTSLTQTTLGCSTTNCHDKLTLHDAFNLTVQVIENGTSVGGTVTHNNTTASTNLVGAITSYSVSFNPSGPTVPLYSHVPLEVNYTLTVSNATISPANVTMTASVANGLTGYVQSKFSIPVVTGVSSYSFWLSDKNLSCPPYDPTCSSISGAYVISVLIVVNGASSPIYGTVVTASNVVNTTDRLNFVSFITVPLTATLLAPLASVVSTGNVTFSVAYTGQFVLSANVTVYSATQTSLAIFSANMLKTPSGNPVSAVWEPLTPGTYPFTVLVTTLYGASVTQHYNLTVRAAGGTVYVNSTNWQNTTNSGLLGLSGAAGGTLLLLVGLIVGLIVALLLGRAMYARPPAAPAQPWTETPKAAAANTCSVCGKSFATPDELQAHAKSEHGM
jgi:hypothetical protein